MPQMMPLNWFMLMLFMLFLLVGVNILLSYVYILEKKYFKINLKYEKKYNWLW